MVHFVALGRVRPEWRLDKAQNFLSQGLCWPVWERLRKRIRREICSILRIVWLSLRLLAMASASASNSEEDRATVMVLPLTLRVHW
jgi:hypothetical protein